jgi:4-amino-4-deoxy-L-arabinose transferase-like glycosyltransferase
MEAPRAAGRSQWLRVHPLPLVLVAQAVVSGRLAWVNSAFGDEAQYLHDGRLEWQAWLHGTPAPVLHLSGAPQIYPPLGAAAAALGGLPLARLLSLAFMLGATALLYAAASRLFGRTVALWAAALGAFNEPVLRLTFATYDALSILLLMAAFYLAVRSASARLSGELVAAAGVCLLLSALVAVSFAIYIPVVAAVMLCVWAERHGWDNAIVPVVWQFVLLGALAVIGVSQLHVWRDFVATTVERTTGLGASVSSVVSFAWSWAGPLVVLAVAGVVVAFVSFGWRNPRGWLVFVFALAGVVVPAYQAYLGSTYSMDKHMVPGAELAAVAVGYLASRVLAASRVRAGWQRAAAFGLSAVLLSSSLVYGAWMAYSAFRQWPDTNTLIAALRAPLAAVPQGPDDGSLLVDTSGVAPFNPAIFGYYLPDATVGSSADPAAVANVAAGRYTVAVQKLDSAALEADALTSAATPELQQAVLAAAKRDKVGAELATRGRYAITDVLPWTTTSPADPSGVFVIWTLKTAAS